jgi:hypothetical protein
MYVDAFASGSVIEDVYIHDNVFQNESQYYLTPSGGMPVLDLGGVWENVEIWHDTVEGMGATDRLNPLLQIDNQPRAGTVAIVDCNDYTDLSSFPDTVNGNFAMPSTSWLNLAGWQKGNGHGWDRDSGVGSYPASCPKTSNS